MDACIDIAFRSCGGYTDSDTGTAELEGRGAASRRKKKERKRTTNLGPRIRVLRITPVAEAVPPSPTPAAAAEDTGGAAATAVDTGPAEVAKVDVKVPVTRKKHFHCGLFSVADLDPSDLYVFGPPGSSYHQAKIVLKNLNSYCFVTSF
jgi:hypothetical protein